MTTGNRVMPPGPDRVWPEPASVVLARDVAALNPPAQVGQLFGVTL
jgi:hypothetical protein